MTAARIVTALSLLAALGCRSADSVVVVTVTDEDGNVAEVRQLRVTLSNGLEYDVRVFPRTVGQVPISFPADFALVLPRARTGELDLALEGLDATQNQVAHGSDRTTIKIGEVVRLSIELNPGPSSCGNGIREPGEECDDGNRLSNDECDFRCRRIVRPDAGADLGRADTRPVAEAGSLADADFLTAPPTDAPGDAPAADASVPPDLRPPDAPPPRDTAPPDLPRDVAPDQAPRRRHVLMVTNDPTVSGSGDRAVRARLEARGFLVTPVLDQAVTAADAAGKDLVLLVDSARSAEVRTKLRDVSTPVLCTDALLFADMAFTGPVEGTDHGFAPAETELQVVMPDHPLAAGLAGTVRVMTNPGRVSWGIPGPGAVRVVTLAGNAGRPTVFGYPAGAMMIGRVAPARRLAWPVSHNAALLTADGWRLFDAAVDWVLAP